MDITSDSKRMLLVVDPQIDFITGVLPVPGAREAMDLLAGYIAAADGKYAVKVVTADCHPYNHCSFDECGGRWPRHCVADTEGAAIWPALVDPLYRTAGGVTVLHKGRERDVEEYSIFKNADARACIMNIVERLGIEKIDICGLAGDVCVADTLRDGIGIFGASKFEVLAQYSPSLDRGVTLDHIISTNNLTSCDR
ncbi:MAG: isochorismatase family protein [Candidatus Amulumruptor sp.]|nr:isochorismatase family protein [Candidatus Amulumruptor sp.]